MKSKHYSGDWDSVGIASFNCAEGRSLKMFKSEV